VKLNFIIESNLSRQTHEFKSKKSHEFHELTPI
jgi:hypothetical protein